MAKIRSVTRGGSRSKLFGEWEKFERIIRNLSSAKYMDDLQPAYEKLGNGIREYARTLINTQALAWEPLSASTIAKKGHSNVYWDTRFLRDNIKVEFKRTTQRTIVISIFPADVKHPTGPSLQEVAASMEFGTNRMPARPLWRPILKTIPTLRIFKEFQREVLRKIVS